MPQPGSGRRLRLGLPRGRRGDQVRELVVVRMGKEKKHFLGSGTLVEAEDLVPSPIAVAGLQARQRVDDDGRMPVIGERRHERADGHDRFRQAGLQITQQRALLRPEGRLAHLLQREPVLRRAGDALAFGPEFRLAGYQLAHGGAQFVWITSGGAILHAAEKPCLHVHIQIYHDAFLSGVGYLAVGASSVGPLLPRVSAREIEAALSRRTVGSIIVRAEGMATNAAAATRPGLSPTTSADGPARA